MKIVYVVTHHSMKLPLAIFETKEAAEKFIKAWHNEHKNPKTMKSWICAYYVREK